ncbi:Antirestriction protein [Serratia quinivorans]|uniref:LPD38 domain-containing protein n=1 Tax=Serratia quinivorans TaxID=137545 RepID=UPI0021779F55|nr:LPD38 domain-containing protein [Serratia quinivorans]CAI1616440.1 Antirestriction protein [Serratia quinivorans]CAI2395277.1 Antirestriction protein [Serratia quinivorans]
MAYDPQQQRPEEQALNNNRESLNIRQPGETGSTSFDWEQVRKAREAAGRKTLVPDPSIGLGDMVRAVGSAPLDMARDSAQLFHAGNEILERKGTEFKSGKNQPLINVDVDPALLQVMRESSGNPLSKTASAIISGAGKLAGNASDAIQSGYSEDAKLAASMKPFDYDKEKGVTVNPGLFDKDVWFMNALPAITQMLTGGLVAKVGAKTAENVVEQAVYNKLSKTIPEQVARATAKETAQLASARAHKTGFVGAMTLPAQGGGGTNMREEINALPFNSLIESPSFQKAFDEVDLNPANASLSDTEKLTLARNQVADKAASAITADPRMLMVNIAASVLGDHTLAKLVTKQIAVKGPLQGAILGATSEAATEQLQGSSQRYVQNEQLINTAGQKIDPMKDVISTGMNNAMFGMGIGGGAGVIGGFRGSRSTPEQQSVEQQNQPVNTEAATGEQQPVTGNNPESMPDQPAQTAPGQFAAEEVAGTAPTRADEFRDTPAYLRQDPRIQGFAEDNDVQRSLAEQQPSPTADELIQQQMESGDQGYSPEELAAQERADQIREALMPRLPPPGKTSVIAMPGEVANVNVDDAQVGDGPQFRAGEQVRGQQFIPRDADPRRSEVGRASQTYDGETVPGNAITDKNIIFADGPVTNTDDMQAGSGPAFTRGETRDQRNLREYSEGIGANNQPQGLPDNRQRAGGVPIDAQTEAYAKGEPVGELRFFGDKPFATLRMAQASRSGKTPGAKIEEVEGGYAIRMPVEKAPAPEPQTVATENGLTKDESAELIQRMLADDSAGGHVMSIFRAAHGTPEERRMYGAQYRPVLNAHRAKKPHWRGNAEFDDTGSDHGSTRHEDHIDDFGQKLEGAAKHKWGKFSEAMERDATDEQYRTEPLSKLFPQPDYSKMSADGVGSDKLALLSMLRAQIPPTKPKRLLQRWVESAQTMKGLSGDLLSGRVSVADVREQMRNSKNLRGMLDTHDLISSLPPEQMAAASKYRVRHSHYSMYEGKQYPDPGKSVYELETAKGSAVGGVADTDKANFMDKARAFIDQQSGGAPASKQTNFTIHADRLTRDIFIGYKGASGVARVKEGFKDPRAARDYLNENRAELESQIAKQRDKARTEQRRDTNAPRAGAERRSADVTPTQFDKEFGFRGVQFGNYVESGRRQAELNDAFDSLHDMADIIGVPAKAISLNGELGLAFGARGRGGSNAVKAHYEPGEVVINLTKNNGAGSLAHEWFHALDNYFGQADVGGGRGDNYATVRRRQTMKFQGGKMVPADFPVRQEVWNAWKGVMKAVGDSGMVARAQKLDELRSKPYWATNVEMAARSYERYILDRAEAKGIRNDYLVNLKKGDEHGNPDTYAYPTEAELNNGVRDAFDTLFKTLKTKPTDRGVAFYSKDGLDIGGGNILSEGNFDVSGAKPDKGMGDKQAQHIADQWVRRFNGAAKIKVQVVQSQAAAAAMMPNGIPKEFGTVHAIYQPELSRVIVVADNIADGKQLRAKLRHEILAHHGLASVIGDVEYDRIIRVLHQTRDSKSPEIQSVWRQVQKAYGNESPEVQANEFLAHMAERSELTGLGHVWDRFVAIITNALRNAGFFNPGDITPSEIRNILHSIAGRFKRTAMYEGEQPGSREFDDTFSRTDALYSASGRKDPFKPDSYDAKNFAAEVEDIAGMENAPRGIVRLGDTPAVYRALGARNLEMVMPASVVHKATDPTVRAHQVRLEDMQRLPELIADPVAVMRSATEGDALVSLVEAKDVYGNPVIAAIHLNGKGAGFAEINKIASVYGKDNNVALQRQLDNNLLYLNNGKAAKWLHAVGLQLPEANTLSGSSKNILSPDDIRKNTALYSRTGEATMDEITNRKMGFNVEKGKVEKAKDFYGMVKSKDRAELKSWLQEMGRKLNTKTFDGMAPLKYAEDAAGKSDTRSSAYIGARMAAGAGSVTAATLEHGLPKYNKAEGVVERQAGTGKEDALMGILDSLGNHRENFLKWIAGHRSERLMVEGKENNFTADEIAYMKGLNKGNEALFDAQKKKYDRFIKSILDLQQDMGLIDPESRASWESAWYLPYYREAEDGEVKGPWSTRGIANQSSTVRKLKGSELTIKDPIENLFNYVAKSVDASMKNEAMRRAVVNLADTGVLEVIDSPNKMDFERIGKDVVKVFTDGKEQLVQVNDPELYRAFTMIDLERSNSAFMKAARQAKKVLTIGTTSMPDFIVRNFLRDSLHSWAINKDGFKAVTDSFRGFNKALKTDDSLIDMMFAGATFGGGYSNVYDPASTARSIRGVLRRKGYTDSQIKEFESSIVKSGKDVMDKLGAGLEKYRHLSEAAENANRLATYEAAIKSGKGKAQAAFESRDLMDFSMMGASKIMINLSDMLPFFNARMQGLSKLGRAIKSDPQGVLKRGGMITAASLALLALNWDDPRYEELPDWDKDSYWHFFLPGGLHIRMPKPFEFGTFFATMPERLVRALDGKDSAGKFGKLVAHNFMEMMAFNPIPQVAMPIAEAYVNYDFFKGGPIENMADSNLIAGARYNDQTSLLMREIGEATNLSPKMLDHIIQGYTGSLGAYVMGATNIMMRGMQDNGETASMRLDEMPVIKSLLRGYGDDPAKSTQFSEDFYRMMTQVNQINSTINSYRKQGRIEDAQELQAENRDKLSQRKGLTATQTELRQLNNRIELVRIDRILTAEQKRERIDRFMAQRNKLVQQAVERVNPYFNK